jgi:hypothetical protein
MLAAICAKIATDLRDWRIRGWEERLASFASGEPNPDEIQYLVLQMMGRLPDQVTPFFVAARDGNVDEVRRLLGEVDRNPGRLAEIPKRVRGNDPLLVAARNGHVFVVEEVLNFWLRHPELRDNMSLQLTSVMGAAAKTGQLEVVSMLFLWGMRYPELRPELISEMWWNASPLYKAATNGRHELVSFIFQFAVEHPDFAEWVLIGAEFALRGAIESGDGAAETVRVIMESPFADRFLTGIKEIHESPRMKILNSVRSYEAARPYL